MRKGSTVLPWETSLAWRSKKVTGPRSLPISRPNTESLSPGSQQEISKCCTCELSFMQLISAHLLPSLCCNPASRHRAVTERGPLAGSLITRDNTGARNCELVQPGLRWHLVPTMGCHRGFPHPPPVLSYTQTMVHKQPSPPPLSANGMNLGESLCRSR